MMQYAAVAGRPPLTYKNDVSDLDIQGILLNQDLVVFDSVEALEKEADNLLTNNEYRMEREKNVINTVISVGNFNKELEHIIEQHASSYCIQFHDIDTSTFRESYIKRFDYKITFERAIANKNNGSLFCEYPKIFIKRMIKMGIKKLKSIGK